MEKFKIIITNKIDFTGVKLTKIVRCKSKGYLNFFVSAYALTVLAQKEKNMYNELANIWYEVFGIFMFMIDYDKIWYKKVV